MENHDNELLELSGLEVEIPLRKGEVHALAGVDLSIRRGETVGVVGESGCGKTMTALSIMGLLPPGGRVTGGQIHLAGRNLVGLDSKEVRKIRGTEVGMIFQDPLTSLNPTMRIGVQVGEPLRVHQGASKAEAREEAIAILRRVGMPRPDRIVDDYPHQLSGGMRQRAMIAMALVCRPKLLIADEPTTALDVTTQKQILELIDDLREEFHMGVMLITHDLGVVADRTDKVAVMYAGKIAEVAPTMELFARPRHQYTTALLAALPEQALHSGGRLFSIPGTPPDLSKPITGCRFAPRCAAVNATCTSSEPPLTLTAAEHLLACFHPADRIPVTEKKTPHPTTPTVSAPVSVATAVDNHRPPTETPNLLEVREVTKEFAATAGKIVRRRVGTISAVDKVSFSLRRGETFGLVGESGCGKSTVGRVIAGLDNPTGGQVFLAGEDVHPKKKDARRLIHRDVQMMFQDSYAAMDPRMRIDEILVEPLAIQKVGNRTARVERVEELLAQVGLRPGVLGRYPHEFSGGQLQRIGFARSLALAPDLIVADEPVSALDVSVQAQVLNLMKDLQAELGLSYLFISHDLAVVQYMANRIGVMYLGRLVEVGPAAEVALHPRHPYTRALIDAVPVADPTKRRREAVTITGELPSAHNPPSGCRFRTRCPLATVACEAQPVLSGDDHQVACHFPLN